MQPIHQSNAGTLRDSNAAAHRAPAFAASPMLLLGASFGDACSEVSRWIDNLDRQGWFLVFCGAVVVGAICLRGFGSRSDY